MPLVISGHPLGVLTFATAESGRRYTQGDLALAMDLAHRAAVAIENTQLYQALRDADDGSDAQLPWHPPRRHQPSGWCWIMTISLRLSSTCL